MKITFLGTGASHGIPVIGCNCAICTSTDPLDHRLRTSALVHTSNYKFVIDVGPDFRQQVLRQGLTKVDAVLLTHEHKDHTAGLDDLRAFNYLMKRPIPIYAEARVLDSLRKEYHYVFAENKYPGAPQMDLHEIDEAKFSINEVQIEPLRLWHNNLPVFGYRMGSFAYITDFKSMDNTVKQRLYGLDTLVVSALRVEPHVSHLGLQEALDLIELLKPRKAFLTHISHKQHNYQSLRKLLPANVEPAYDGLTIDVMD